MPSRGPRAAAAPFLPLTMAALLLSGCAGLDPWREPPARDWSARGGSATAPASVPAEDTPAGCAARFAAADRVVDAAGVRDAEAPRVPGFPWLRVNRLLAALAPPADDAGRFAVWIARLAALDAEARRIEHANLPPGADRAVTDPAALERCRSRLLHAHDAAASHAQAHDAAASHAQLRTQLAAAAKAPDDYVTGARIAGLYALTRIPFAAGVRRWQRDTQAVFDQPLERLAFRGAPVHYRLGGGQSRPDAAGARTMLDAAPRDALGLPVFEPLALAGLFAAFAPEVVVDEATPDDRIGRMERDHQGEAWVNFFRPTLYTRLAFTRFSGRVHAQLVYTLWFGARPPEPAGDLLAGRLDGLMWRVTLDHDGAVLAFDTIHPCGCYHLFIPTARLAARPQPDTLDEGLFAPQVLGPVDADARIGLRLSAGAHYLERVMIDPIFTGELRPYAILPEDALRSLEHAANGADAPRPRASLYDARGFVPGTERGERFLFWPMGVENAGAMRQWGRHATAFVGRRHFDEPDLLDRYFIRR